MRIFPSYVEANKGYYEKVADSYYELTSQARCVEDFEKLVNQFCCANRTEIMNDDILSFMLENGYLEKDDYITIKGWIKSHLEPMQKEFINADLQEGKRYTIVKFNSFGFPVADKITFNSVTPCTYAQYNDAVKIIFKRKGGRKLLGQYLYNTEVLVYDGWVELPEDVVYIKESEYMKQSKYGCFDKQYIKDCIEYFGQPLLKAGC